ncbi:hypothetical protein CP556_21240 [Natrinema sp. CBA1119]|uniref:DUF1152 domain-containing protein n=1 Tax=Natrinema sp. CBA1119 TaxID=1608465 RepID=UPI000BF8DBFA|nr:DUF1152 domain-containing protein [Natrinema sp. CBA1119]PGF14653.1 hypothetical protein CP556_21240 [Natrinema sp. CBA1119]
MNTLEDSFDVDRALVFGIGGSGDVVGSIPTARFLESVGVDVILGGTTWEPVPRDSRPGPRSLSEVVDYERISETVGMANGDTRTEDGLVFCESLVADHFEQRVALIDISRGVREMTSGLRDACETLEVDLVVGVDAGGDILARGDEPGLRSPVTDGLGLVTLEKLDIDTCIGVIGFGSDGELTLDELDRAFESLSEDALLGSWGITRQVRSELEAVLDIVDTEASRLPVEAARGELGERTIRRGELSLEVTVPSSVTFYFETSPVADRSDVATLVRDTTTLDEAVSALRTGGYSIEFDKERNRID